MDSSRSLDYSKPRSRQSLQPPRSDVPNRSAHQRIAYDQDRYYDSKRFTGQYEMPLQSQLTYHQNPFECRNRRVHDNFLRFDPPTKQFREHYSYEKDPYYDQNASYKVNNTPLYLVSR